MDQNKSAKKPNQFQRAMIRMEKAGAVRRDGKSTAVELGVMSEQDFRDAVSKQCGFPSVLQSAENERYGRKPFPEPYNEYPCPNCEAEVRVGLPAGKNVVCQECKTKLEIHPDAEQDEDGWHDRTTLSIVETEVS